MRDIFIFLHIKIFFYFVRIHYRTPSLMKNVYQTLKHTKFREKRAIKEKFKRRRFRFLKIARLILYLAKNKKEIIKFRKNKSRSISRNLTNPQIDYHYVNAPVDFSFRKNYREVTAFINKIKTHFDKKHNVYVRFDHVINIDYDAIVILLSILVRFKAKKIHFNGTYPRNTVAAEKLKGSGFFQALKQRDFKESKNYFLGSENSIISTHAETTVDSKRSNEILKKAAKFIWNEERRIPRVQTVFIELMQNTVDHAARKEHKRTKVHDNDKRHWWVSVSYKEIGQNKSVCFAFIDYGVGIFESLKNKPETSFWYKILDKIKERFNPKDDSDALKHILSGELRATSTGQPFRGKGLPGIKQAFDNEQIFNLHIITNNVYASISENKYFLMPCDFKGTFVYWEINESTTSFKIE